jgi:hypothetical protein
MRVLPMTLNYTRIELIRALREMPTICPPRIDRQDKADLQACVVRALYRSGPNVAARMMHALKKAAL